ncbi:hypothetical protein VNO78_05263 [Psophocarpus tetragonolobus]|uniref:3-oxo-5-alpha-steroid 4-dehydrogenase C-terminal domain-containing protein n=1 Tax=Psophocarpus tetragonolobus TaxID=3891 RepID=A0AAN9XQZ8_PSOTE
MPHSAVGRIPPHSTQPTIHKSLPLSPPSRRLDHSDHESTSSLALRAVAAAIPASFEPYSPTPPSLPLFTQLNFDCIEGFSTSAALNVTVQFAIEPCISGMSFYIGAPLLLCGDCTVEVYNFLANLATEFIVKGKNQMQVTELEFWQFLTPLFKLGWKHWIGAAVFLWGWIHQRQCHKILDSLRHSREADEYVIPHGDWFDIVSSPHYLSEIVANLSFAAVETHSWYRQKFEDYPNSRFAIIPFIM